MKEIIAKRHMVRYVDAVFAERMKKEGFSPLKTSKLNWYRIVGDDIVQSIIFKPMSHFMAPIAFAELYYGIHPLFIRPMRYPSDRKYYGYHRVGMMRELITEAPEVDQTMAPYSEDCMIMCPEGGGRGLYTFEKILLPRMNEIQTHRQCYDLHIWNIERKSRYPLDVRYGNVEEDLISEVLLLEDEERFEYCRHALKNLTDRYDYLENVRKNEKGFEEVRQFIYLLNDVINGSRREEFLATLEVNKQQNKAELERRLSHNFN